MLAFVSMIIMIYVFSFAIYAKASISLVSFHNMFYEAKKIFMLVHMNLLQDDFLLAWQPE